MSDTIRFSSGTSRNGVFYTSYTDENGRLHLFANERGVYELAGHIVSTLARHGTQNIPALCIRFNKRFGRPGNSGGSQPFQRSDFAQVLRQLVRVGAVSKERGKYTLTEHGQAIWAETARDWSSKHERFSEYPR